MDQDRSAHRDLTQGPILQHLIKMASPMAIGILAIMSMYLADTFFLGQLGKEPLAAMGFIFPVIGILNAIAFGVGAGASSVIARTIGAKDLERVKYLTTQAILLGFLLALSFSWGGLNTIQPLFTLLGAPTALIPAIETYMTTWYSGCFLVVIPMIGNAAIRAAGNSHIPSLIMISVAIVNLILDPILIFGLWGAPRLELQGAAIATIIAYSFSFILALYILRYKLNMMAVRHCLQQITQGWQAILRVAIPAIGNNLILPFCNVIAIKLVSGHGIAAVAGFNVALRIDAFCIIPLMAISSVMGPFSGQNLGAQTMGRLQLGTRYSFQFALIWGFTSATLLHFIAPYVTSLFNQDSAVQTIATHYLQIIPWSYALLGITMITASCATGMGDAISALKLTLLRLLILYLPLALLANFIWGLLGIFTAALIANCLTGIAAFSWMQARLGMWK